MSLLEEAKASNELDGDTHSVHDFPHAIFWGKCEDTLRQLHKHYPSYEGLKSDGTLRAAIESSYDYLFNDLAPGGPEIGEPLAKVARTLDTALGQATMDLIRYRGKGKLTTEDNAAILVAIVLKFIDNHNWPNREEGQK